VANHLLLKPSFFLKAPLTSAALGLITLIILIYFFNHLDQKSTISWDAFGYYYYLPLIFVQKNLIIENFAVIQEIFDLYKPSSTIYQFNLLPNGRIIIMYTCGQAVLYAPFFLIGHITAILGGFPIDGFSAPYDVSSRIGSLFYNVLSFYLLARLLVHFFHDRIVAVTLVLLFFGTNAVLFLNGHAFSAQASLFFLMALFMLLIHYFYLRKTDSLALFAGLTFGLICISRPTDGIIMVPAILWPMMIPGKDVESEIRLIFEKHLRSIIIFASGALAMVAIQMFYWKIAGGSWIINSYGNPGEGLDFLSPHTIPFLFSFRTGWFIYTPLMLLVSLFLFRNVLVKSKTQLPVFVFFVLFLYIASSWTNYWYGGSFSQRAMVQAYVLLSFPLAALLVWLNAKKGLVRGFFGGFFVLCIVLNLWQSTQFRSGVFPSPIVTKEYYLASFFDLNRDLANDHLLSIDRDPYYLSMENEVPPGYVKINTYPAKLKENTIQMEGVEFPADFRMAYRDFCPSDHCWVGFNATFRGAPAEGALLVTTINRRGGNYRYQTQDAKDYITEENSEGYVTATSFYLTPEMRSTSDDLHVYIWNRDLSAGELTEISIDVYIREDAAHQ